MSHDHAHEPAALAGVGRAFAIGIALNSAFVVVEVVFGLFADSTALLADAAHNLTDVVGLGMAWAATALARRPPSDRHTYGIRRVTVLAALANALLLVAAVGAVAWEAVGRLRTTSDAHSTTMIVVAAVGVVVNGASALLFLNRRKGDANLRGAFLHLAADAAVSAGVIVAGIVLWKTGWSWIDPVASLGISAVILLGTWGLLRDSLHLALDGVPKEIELEEVRTLLRTLPGVQSIHDVHVWAMSTTEVALTAHLVMPWRDCPPSFLASLEHDLAERFGISHVTVQIDPPESDDCERGASGAV
jgi:cobalt-zinc-cadmium efflux system protein